MAETLIFALAALAVLAVIGLVIATRRGETPEETRARSAIEESRRARAEEEAPASRAQAPTAVREPPPAPPVETPPVEAPVRPSLRDRLGRSRRFLIDRLTDALSGSIDDDTWDDLEAALIQGDVGVTTATSVIGELKSLARERRALTTDEVRGLLTERLLERFDLSRDRALAFAPQRPTVWLVAGVNGTGKTTTIGKLAADLAARGRSVALAAADTFRAAADEQLGIWAERSGAHLVKHQPGADPAAVAFDAYAFARARGLDVLIIDTAGRLHTKTPLMDELAKIRRVVEREGAVNEVLLVLDATAGQNGLVQAKQFTEALGVTGIVLTKLDGTAKGGIAIAVEETLGIPIKLIGVGEDLDDLEAFDPKVFVDALLS